MTVEASVLRQLNLSVAELVKSFEQHRELPKVLTTSATVETLILSCNAPQGCYSSTTSAGDGCGVILVRPKSTRLPLVIS